jgi:hypothetical protein
MSPPLGGLGGQNNRNERGSGGKKERSWGQKQDGFGAKTKMEIRGISIEENLILENYD